MSRKKTHNSDNYIFAFNINKLAKIYGGKYALADKIGVNYDSVRRWCNGDNLPDGQTLLKLQDIFHVSIDWLLTGKSSSESKCPFCGDLSKNTREAIIILNEIFESKDEEIIPALQANLAAFHSAVKRTVVIRELREDVKLLKSEVKHLKMLNEPGEPRTGTD